MTGKESRGEEKKDRQGNAKRNGEIRQQSRRGEERRNGERRLEKKEGKEKVGEVKEEVKG